MEEEPGLGTLGERVRWARRRAKLTQVRLAALAGIHKDTVSGWETGKIGGDEVREANLRAVAPYLKVSADWLREGGATPRIPVAGPLTDAPGIPTRSPGRRAEDVELRASAKRKDAARLDMVIHLMQAYRDAGRAAGPGVLDEWLLILAANPPGPDGGPLG